MAESSSSEIASVGELLAESTPGKHLRRLRVGTTPSGSQITVPIHYIRGSHDGPRLALLSGVHGDEGLGPLALGRFLRSVDPGELVGSILAIPVANPPAFESRSRVNGWDGGDLIRLWPGNPEGSITERMAHAIFEAVTNGADALIDLHSGTPVLHEYWILYANSRGPRANVTPDIERRSLDLARAFGVTQIIRGHPWFGTHMAGGNAGIPSLVTEIGGGADYYHNGERYLGVIVGGITNAARHLGMLRGDVELEGNAGIFDIAEEFIATSDPSGYWIREVAPGQNVKPGALVGRVVDPSTGEELRRLAARIGGVVLNPMAGWPQVGNGQWLLALGTPVRETGALETGE